MNTLLSMCNLLCKTDYKADQQGSIFNLLCCSVTVQNLWLTKTIDTLYWHICALCNKIVL